MDRHPNSRGNGRERRRWSDRLAWLPIPVLLAAMVALWAADLNGIHESAYLLLVLNFVCATLVSLFISYLIARNFLVGGAPGLLLLGCGVIVWGVASFVGVAVAPADGNTQATICNIGACLSALCHLGGVLLSLRPRRGLRLPGPWLALGYTFALGFVGVVTLSALAHRIPVFFIQGRGGTPVRQVVLSLAVVMFTLTAGLLGATKRRPASAFTYWYTPALTLIAAGLLGVMIQTAHGSVLGWTGRGTQYLGGVYMLVAAIASVRESHIWGISLQAALREERDFNAAVLDTAGALVVVLDAQGRITRFNRACERLTGYRAADVLGRACRKLLVPPEERAGTWETWQALHPGTVPCRHENHWLARDGTRRLIDWSSTALRGEAGEVRHVIGIGIDITERRQTEETLRQTLLEAQQRCAETSALMACTRAVLEHQELIATVDTVFGACRTLLAAEAGYVAVLTPDEKHTRVLFLEPGGSSCAADPSLPMPLRGLRAEVCRTGRVLYENDFGNGPWADLLPPGHVRLENVLFAPLVVEGRTIGVLGLGNKPGGFTDHDATLAATFGELLAIALRNARTRESLHELNATLESKVTQRTAELERRSRQLQKLTLELTRAEDRERERIAALLHEDLQQHLAAAKFHLSALKRRAPYDPQFAVIEHVDEMLKEAIEKSRNLSRDLSPALLHMNDLREVLQWLATQAQAKHALTVRVDIRDEVVLPSETLTTFLFRAAQEILFNVTKHARVREAVIRVRRVGHYLYLSVTDRGCGFDPQTLKHTPGFGLLSIRERIDLLGGRMKIRSTRRQGSTVVIALPYEGTLCAVGTAVDG